MSASDGATPRERDIERWDAEADVAIVGLGVASACRGLRGHAWRGGEMRVQVLVG